MSTTGHATDPGTGPGSGRDATEGPPSDRGPGSRWPGSRGPRGPRHSGQGVGPALLALLAAIGAAIRSGFMRLREWNRRDGAGESGLAQLIEVHVLQTAGDATVAVALAGSLFFSVPTHEARSRVALYLLITVAPFAVVAPILGPLLDRFRHGRRIALAVTMGARTFLALVIAHSLSHGTQVITLYPAALGVLVASKAYTVARAAAVPRLVPPKISLVSANARLTISGVIAPFVAASFAIAVRTTLGATVELELGAAVYVLAAVFAIRLPPAADGGQAEFFAAPRGSGGRGRFGNAFPQAVLDALSSAAVLRWLSGFTLFYGAFVVREHSLSGLSGNEALGVLAAGIGLGNFIGAATGSRVRQLRQSGTGLLLIAATAVLAALVAISFDAATAFGLALIGAAAAAMTKLALDSTIQDRVSDATRGSTFGRSETVMQLSWVVGGVVGILLPTRPAIGFSVAAIVLGGLCAVAALLRARGGARVADAH